MLERRLKKKVSVARRKERFRIRLHCDLELRNLLFSSRGFCSVGVRSLWVVIVECCDCCFRGQTSINCFECLRIVWFGLLRLDKWLMVKPQDALPVNIYICFVRKKNL
ncbi:hypothetical protein TNIN_414611 [Trichonephila inaurata madagascariensis]|uniref:Uncharacterized protein n=1 Tax=Trichonephila inaurata madagascariensis TaxID=2747483 RepID=A0A8X6XIH1_9ARAC|nr:hypothetical protein TNIN_414611 [Trichonephila inaurata madagascariensis]